MKFPVKTETNEQECHLVVSHKLNADGYFRKNVEGKLVMYHRFIYESEVGEIPEGYEIDHKCRNRSCINPEHLQVLTRTDHLVKTNKERYKERKEKAKNYWLEHKPSGVDLGKLFNVTFSSSCGWIREWKVEL